MGQNDVNISARSLQLLWREISSSLDPKIVLSSLAAGTSRILHPSHCSVVRVDAERHPGRGFVFTAVDDPALEGYSLDLADYPEIEIALREKRPIRIQNDLTDPIASLIRKRQRDLPFPLSVVLPICFESQTFGVLVLRFAEAGAAVSDEAVALCQTVAFGAATALNSAREYETLVAEVKRREHEAEALREALLLRIDLLSIASNDLRAPLNSIVGYLDLLGEGSYGELEPEQYGIVAQVERSALSLLEIVNSIIDHARLERGEIPLAVEAGEVAPLLEELRLAIEPLVSRRPVRIRFESAGSLAMLETDWLKLKRILLNLLHAALKFTDRGEVSLNVSSREGRIRFVVADTGSGIATADLSEIFDPFSGAHPARPKGPGGLGLTIARRYCEMLHGTINVASSIGQGTRFTIELPLRWPEPGGPHNGGA